MALERSNRKWMKNRARVSEMTMEEFAATEEKWAKTTVPSEQEVENIEDYVIYLSTEVAQLVETQPKCSVLKENYDNAFSEYRARVAEVRGANRRALKIVDGFSHAKDRLVNVQNDMETLRELAVRNRGFWDEWQKNYFMEILGYLGFLKTRLELLGNVRLEGQEELSEELAKTAAILDQLILSTHEWIPLEKRTITVKPEWNPPEGSSMEPRKAEVREFVSNSMCRNCSKQRDESF